MNLPRKPVFWAVSLGHTINDMFMSMGPVILTFLSASVMTMSNTQIGVADSVRQLMGAVSQPVFGWLADRTGGRLLGAGGVFWTVTVMMVALLLALTTGNYWLMLVPYALSALGSGAFHPVGSLHAAEADGARVATRVAMFFLAGQFGLALGPTIVGQLLSSAQTLTPVFLLALVVVPSAVFMALTIPGRAAYRARKDAERRDNAPRAVYQIPVRSFMLLTGLVTLRSLAQPGVVPFIPVLFNSKGFDPASYGLITSSFWLASGITGVWFGTLADRYGRRVVTVLSLLASVPAFALLPLTDQQLPALLLAIAAGGLSGGSHSIIVSLAQELIPSGRAFASGAILGLIFGTGALGSLVMGGLSDRVGLPGAFLIAAGSTVVAAGVGLLMPARRRTQD